MIEAVTYGGNEGILPEPVYTGWRGRADLAANVTVGRSHPRYPSNERAPSSPRAVCRPTFCTGDSPKRPIGTLVAPPG